MASTLNPDPGLAERLLPRSVRRSVLRGWKVLLPLSLLVSLLVASLIGSMLLSHRGKMQLLTGQDQASTLALQYLQPSRSRLSMQLSMHRAKVLHSVRPVRLGQYFQPAESRSLRAMASATPSQPLGHRIGPADAPIRIEAFYDFACPFSAKSFLMLTQQVLPLYEKKAPGKIQFLHYQYPQPWHAPGAYAAEVSLAVEAVDPSKYLATCQSFFAKQVELVFDIVTYDKTRTQIYELLADAAAAASGVDKAAVLGKVRFLGTAPNAGNEVGQMMKYYTKFGRKNGIHVTPTVLINGIEEGQISSGWTLEQWSKFLDEKLA